MDYCSFVDVFHGNGKTELQGLEGLPASWHFIKAICGNTHPGAVLPFGKLSIGCYTEGYPTGYGNHRGNSSPHNLRTFGKAPECKGFSHLHESGTGAMDVYYNYAVAAAHYGDIVDSAVGHELLNEQAKPGYYCVRLADNDILCELTVSERAAIHRYTFPKSGGRITVDLSNDGFKNNDPNHRGYSESSLIKLCGDTAFEAVVVMKGVKLFIYGECAASEGSVLWDDYLPLNGEEALRLGCVKERFGVSFGVSQEDTAELRLSISSKSMEKARADVKGEVRSFDEIAACAYEQWNEALSRIEIEAPTDRDRGIFYSNLYHMLVKPSDWSGESFLYEDEAFVTGFATMWDIYKTQLPLIFSLYPRISERIIATFSSFCEAEGTMPHSFTLTLDHRLRPSTQARMLAEHSIYDAFVRGVKGDYKRALRAAGADLFNPLLEDFHAESCGRATHVLDVSQGCAAMARLARAVGEPADVFERYTDEWKKVFDKATGLLKAESDYYEGSEWNFSFRPMESMEERIAYAGGRERFVRLLDRFFGYTDAQDTSARFEGYNNESDMEAPAAYYYAGRHDRLCEVVSAGIKQMFSDGRGGLPGNDDSGGLSSCYVWNVCGLFPVTGQDLIIIGSPLMNKTVFHLANGKDFTVVKSGSGIYVKNAVLCGRTLEKRSFAASEMMQGGTLLLEMSENAADDRI